MPFLQKYTPVILESFDKLNDLRLHIAFNFFLITNWFLVSLNVPASDSMKYALIFFFFVEFSYLFNRYTDYDYDIIVDSAYKKPEKDTYLYLSYISLFWGALLFLYYDNLFDIKYKLAIFVLGTISAVSYSKNILFKLPLKNYLIVKNIMSAGSKYFVLIAGALLLSPYPAGAILAASLVGFLLNLIFTILWDVRDIEADTVGGVRTLPIVFGKLKTLLICVTLLAVSFLYSILYLERSDAVFLTNQIIILGFIVMVGSVRNPRYFHLMVYIMILFMVSFNTHGLLFVINNPHLLLGK